MASFLVPTVCRVGILDQSNGATTIAATQLYPTINANATGLMIQAHSTNANDLFVGSSAVTAAGAARGFRLVAGDDLGVPITGPGADQFFQISSVATDNVLTMQVG